MIRLKYETSDGKQFNSLEKAEKHTKSLENDISDAFSKYLLSYQGKKILKEHSLSDSGVWEIRGEDPNPDFGGHHHMPYIKTVRGTLRQAIKEAVSLKKFYTYGSGGYIREITIEDL